MSGGTLIEALVRWLVETDTTTSRRQTILTDGLDLGETMNPTPRGFAIEWGPCEVTYEDESGNVHTWIFNTREVNPIRPRRIISMGSANTPIVNGEKQPNRVKLYW